MELLPSGNPGQTLTPPPFVRGQWKKRKQTTGAGKKEPAGWTPPAEADGAHCFLSGSFLNIVSDQCNQERSLHYDKQYGDGSTRLSDIPESVCSQTLWQDLRCHHAPANKGDWIWWETDEARRGEASAAERAGGSTSGQGSGTFLTLISQAQFTDTDANCRFIRSRRCLGQIPLCFCGFIRQNSGPQTLPSALADLSGFRVFWNHLSWFGDGVLPRPDSSRLHPPPADGQREGRRWEQDKGVG